MHLHEKLENYSDSLKHCLISWDEDHVPEAREFVMRELQYVHHDIQIEIEGSSGEADDELWKLRLLLLSEASISQRRKDTAQIIKIGQQIATRRQELKIERDHKEGEELAEIEQRFKEHRVRMGTKLHQMREDWVRHEEMDMFYKNSEKRAAEIDADGHDVISRERERRLKEIEEGNRITTEAQVKHQEDLKIIEEEDIRKEEARKGGKLQLLRESERKRAIRKGYSTFVPK